MSNIKKILIGAFAAVMLFATASDAAYMHTTTLKYGSRNAQVMSLQQTLNMTSCQVAVAGRAGSPGMETSYFGTATVAAVKCFQRANNLVADAIVGPATGAKLAMVTGGPIVITPPAGLPVGCAAAQPTQMFSSVNGQPCVYGGTTPQTGAVMASLSATTPAAGYIIDGQATAGLLDVTFAGNGTVSSVTLKRSGISDQNTLSNVYLYDGANRLTDGYSFNSLGMITINNLSLAVNGSRTISVKADVGAGVSVNSATIAVALTGFTSGASVNTVNIQGNLMNTASGTSLATASFSANTVSSASVNAGTSSYTFWSAPIQVNTRALWLKSASFRMVGSAPADAISNLKLFVDGVDSGVAGSVMMINGSNYVNFNLMAMPKSLSTGSHTMDVRGTIEKGSSRTVQFSLQQAADLMIMDPQIGVNVAVSGTVPNNGGTITINSGSLTVNIDPTFQAMTNVTGGASNVAIAKYKLHAYGEDVKVSSIQVLPVLSSMTPAAAGLQNVTLYFNGSQIGTQQNWTSGALTFSLGSQLIVPAGTDSILEVRTDVRTSAGVNYTAGSISANLVIGSSNAQGQSSFTTFNTPAQTGNILTVQTGLLAVSKNSGYANQSVTPNTAGVKIASFVLQNQSSSEAVRVTNLSLALGFTGSQSLVNYGALRTSETSGSGSTPVQPAATNTFSVDFTLAPGATKTIDVFADTGSTTTGTIIATLTTTSIGVSSNVSQTVSGVAGQTITVGAGSVTNPPTLVTASATSAQYIAAGMGGAADATKATYNFVSTGGASTISELKFAVSGTNTVTSVKVNGVSAPVVSGVAYLTGLNLSVPSGGSGLTQDVFISYSEVGTNGIVPATTSSVALTEVKYSSGGITTTFNPSSTATTYTSGSVALGSQSITVGSTTGMVVGQYITIAGATTAIGTITSITSGTVVVVNITTAGVTPAGAVTFYGTVAPTMTLVGSKPTASVNAAQQLGLILGAENKIGEVTVSADAKGNIKINDISFAIGSSNITTFVITAPRIADGTTTITGSGCVANASVTTTVFCEFGTVGNTFATGAANTESNTDFDGYTIAAGTSKTFSLYGVVGGTITTGGGNTSVSSSVTASAFNWDDTSYATFVADGSVANPANGTNLTGTLIYNFPTASYSIRQ